MHHIWCNRPKRRASNTINTQFLGISEFQSYTILLIFGIFCNFIKLFLVNFFLSLNLLSLCFVKGHIFKYAEVICGVAISLIDVQSKGLVIRYRPRQDLLSLNAILIQDLDITPPV
jgi:hypothetical protein